MLLLLLLFLAWPPLATASCPWPPTSPLQSECSCSVNLAQELTVQCSFVALNQLVAHLNTTSLNLLYVANASVAALNTTSFEGIGEVHSLQLVNAGLETVGNGSFDSLAASLTSLGLQDNLMQEVPSEALRPLRLLNNLDMSRNKLQRISKNAFTDLLRLQILKLSGNRGLKIEDGAFDGLENSLRNLNLQGTEQTTVPTALGNLSALAFLDLAQNMLVTIGEGNLRNLNSLTALILERNPIARLDTGALDGVNDTLSSLSLLNNIIVQFPIEALRPLTQLRVLDLGFNQLRNVPDDAFSGMSALTLLALDGNPLETIPLTPFIHLNRSLRGLSIGGRSLNCDCRIRWISEWIRDNDLQVTSRERNPHFCGKPSRLRESNLVQLQPDELRCNPDPNATTVSIADTTTATSTISLSPTSINKLQDKPTSSSTETRTDQDESLFFRSLRTDGPPPLQRSLDRSPPLVTITNASRNGNSVLVQWEAMPMDDGHLRVAYRLFGDNQFYLSSPQQPTENRLTIQNVPDNQCFVVCVVHVTDDPRLDRMLVPIGAIPPSSCREVRSRTAEANEADKVVIIAASAAICVAIIIAVIIFVCCNRRRLRKEKHQMAMTVPMTPLPVLEPYKNPDWETASVYSTRSIPRAQMYHLEKPDGTVNSAFLIDNGLVHLPVVGEKTLVRRPYSAIGYATMHNGHLNHYPLGRPDTNRSSRSLLPIHGTTTGAPYRKRARQNGAASASFHSLRNSDVAESPRLFKTDKWIHQENADLYTTQMPYSHREYQ